MTKLMFFRRRCPAFFLALTVAGFMATVSARADTDPCQTLAGETIRWIVPFGAGGGFDLYSRILDPFLEARLGAEIVVVNVPGVGGLVGAKQLQQAKPDGRTLGLLHGTNLLISELFGDGDSPRVPEDFTLLGRIGRSADVWIVRDDSPLRTIEDLFAGGGGDRVIMAVPAVASKHWLTAVIASEILGFEADFVIGYKGTKDRVLGLLRGEFDLVGAGASSVLPQVDAGELRPLVMIGVSPVGLEPGFRDVPRLGGPDGLAARRARVLGHDPEVAQSRADALDGTMAAGRLVAAPPGMDPGLASCMEARLFEAMTDSEFTAAMAKAKRPIDPAKGTKAAESISEAKAEAVTFTSIVRDRLDKAGQ